MRRSDAMFETLFVYPKILGRHQRGPEAAGRERYLKHCADQDVARETLLRIAHELLVVAERLDLPADKPVGLKEVEAAAWNWARHQRARRRPDCGEWSRRLFIQVATAWLRFLGRLAEPSHGERNIYSDQVDDFIAYLRDERGLSPSTICSRRWQVESFLRHVSPSKASIASITVGDVDAFFDSKGRGDWGRVSVATR